MSNDIVDPDDLPPVPRFLNGLFSEAQRQGATAIDLEPNKEGVLEVRLFADAAATAARYIPVSRSLRQGVIGRLKSMAGMDKAERGLVQDGSFSLRGEDGGHIEWQITVEPWGEFECARMRVSTASLPLTTFDDLPMPVAYLTAVKEILDRGRGLVLVAGSRNTGGQVLLDACLRYASSPDRTLLSIVEEPRSPIDGVQSALVENVIGNSIDSLLDVAIRSDVEVIRVCEIRDVPTTKLSIRAALEGRLLLATIPMMDAPAAVPRLFDAWIEPEDAASALALVIGVVRVRRLCESCTSSASEGACTPVGCDACQDTGYRGWANAYQNVVVDDEIREAIRTGDSDTIRGAFESRAGSLRDAALTLVEQGLTSLEEAVAQTPD